MSEGSGPYEEEGGGLGWSQNGGSQATILALEGAHTLPHPFSTIKSLYVHSWIYHHAASVCFCFLKLTLRGFTKEETDKFQIPRGP